MAFVLADSRGCLILKMWLDGSWRIEPEIIESTNLKLTSPPEPGRGAGSGIAKGRPRDVFSSASATCHRTSCSGRCQQNRHAASHGRTRRTSEPRRRGPGAAGSSAATRMDVASAMIIEEASFILLFSGRFSCASSKRRGTMDDERSRSLAVGSKKTQEAHRRDGLDVGRGTRRQRIWTTQADEPHSCGEGDFRPVSIVILWDYKAMNNFPLCRGLNIMIS